MKRTAKAKFTRPRGSSEWVKAASDEYHTYIDNIEYNASDFNAWLSTNICKVEHLLYAIDGSFFTFLCEDDRTKARKVLESIVGDITIADFKGDFSAIADKLERLPIEHIEEQTKNEIKPLNRRLEEIPALIADKERTLAEYENIDYDFILSRIEQYKREIEAIDDKILGNATEFAPIIDKRNAILAKIAEVRTIITTEKAKYDTAFKGVLEGVSSEINRVKAENERREARNKEAHRVFDTWKTRLLSLESEYKHLSEVRRPQLLKERDEIKARVFDGDTTSDYCGQELPEDMLEIAFSLRIVHDNVYTGCLLHEYEGVRMLLYKRMNKSLAAVVKERLRMVFVKGYTHYDNRRAEGIPEACHRGGNEAPVVGVHFGDNLCLIACKLHFTHYAVSPCEHMSARHIVSLALFTEFLGDYLA